MPKDIGTGPDFDVRINARRDLDFVSGREQFEQEIRIRLTDGLVDLIGERDPETITSMANVTTRRVASEMDRLSELAYYEASLDEITNDLEIEIVYDTGDTSIVEV